MRRVDFDNFAYTYNEILQKHLEVFGDISYYSEYKVKILTKYFSKSSQINILEYGCGIGRNLPYLRFFFPNASLYATDISKESLSVAKKENKTVKFFLIDDINNYRESFDLIFIAGVYHHIQPVDRYKVTIDIYNLCKPNGHVIVFEHNPYNPITRKLVKECEFDLDAILLTRSELIDIFKKTNFTVIDSQYTLFIPPKLKKFAFIEKYLGWLPLGGQYFVLFKKNYR